MMVGTICEFIENKNGRFRSALSLSMVGKVPYQFRTTFAPICGHCSYFWPAIGRIPKVGRILRKIRGSTFVKMIYQSHNQYLKQIISSYSNNCLIVYQPHKLFSQQPIKLGPCAMPCVCAFPCDLPIWAARGHATWLRAIANRRACLLEHSCA